MQQVKKKNNTNIKKTFSGTGTIKNIDENVSDLKKRSEENDVFGLLKNSKLCYGLVAEKATKLMGERVIDAVMHTPCNYELFHKVESIKQLNHGDTCCVRLTIIKVHNEKLPYYIAKKRKIPIKIGCITDDNINIDLVFFNFFPKMFDAFYIGRQMVCQGRISIDANGKYSIVHPHISQKIQSENGAIAVFKMNQLEDNELLNSKDFFYKISPIYSLTEGIKQIQVVSIIEKIFKKRSYNFSIFDEFDNLLKKSFCSNSGIDDCESCVVDIPTFKDAIMMLHFPRSVEDICKQSLYRKKLAFLELLSFQVALSKARKSKTDNSGFSIFGNGVLREKLKENLPFKLTDDQKRCLDEIYKDQQLEKKMFRLLQGDVGSGKTIVSLFACLNAIESGKKAIIMAPTAILAKQHFLTIQKFCTGLGVYAELLIGETKQKNRKDILSRFKLGMVDILVGTHTLFQKSIDLPNNIGLFVIDEQHNFGVEQRADLLKKSANADILMMSATPIPRTMIMALYGDISVSRITTKPADRLPIQTKVIGYTEKYNKLVEAIKRKINDNEKIYWVCPLVEESEKLDYIDVKTRYNDLCNYIDKNKVCLLHGKMSQEQKDKAMNDFKNGNINLLISTTVIEVGIDVPDATVIVIENAEKFGLAQLHQLRGRVGRGSKQSYCFLLYGDKITDIGRRRLEILKNNSDGFVIADEDLKIRGGGTILDKKQSGFNNTSFINFIYDKDIISFLNSIDLSLLDDKKIQPIIRLFYHNNENITNFIAS